MSFFYKYNKTLKKLITITTTKITETILTTFSFIFIHLITNYKINVIKSKFVFFIDQVIENKIVKRRAYEKNKRK